MFYSWPPLSHYSSPEVVIVFCLSFKKRNSYKHTHTHIYIHMPIFKIEILHLDFIFNVLKCIPKNTYKWSNFFSRLLVFCSIGEHNFFQPIFQDRLLVFKKCFDSFKTAVKILFYTYICVYRILLKVEILFKGLMYFLFW